jgi:hypothetical protein
MMTYKQARKVIYDEKTSFIDCAIAGALIAGEKTSSLEDLLQCLRRGGQAASAAVCALYVRTKRPAPKSPLEFIMDAEDWSNYLKQAGLWRGSGRGS